MKSTVDFQSRTGEWVIIPDINLPIDDSGDPVGYTYCDGLGGNVAFDTESKYTLLWKTYLATDHSQQFHVLIVSGHHEQAHVIAFETTAHYLLFNEAVGLRRMFDEVGPFTAKATK